MKMIYHYTTLKSFKGMLHNPEGWELDKANDLKDRDCAYYLDFHASDVRMMNDKRENSLINDIFREVPDNLRTYFCRADWEYGLPYAISFCEYRDYIPMWRGYANGDYGICLGFCMDEFERKINELNETKYNDFVLKECEYLTSSQMENRKTEIVERLWKISNSLAICKNIIPLLKEIKEMMIQSALCKSTEFEYEHEIRGVELFAHPSKVKGGRYGVTVCHSIKIPMSHLMEIIISPYVKDKKVAEAKINELLRNIFCSEMGMAEIPVKVELSKFV